LRKVAASQGHNVAAEDPIQFVEKALFSYAPFLAESVWCA